MFVGGWWSGTGRLFGFIECFDVVFLQVFDDAVVGGFGWGGVSIFNCLIPFFQVWCVGAWAAAFYTFAACAGEDLLECADLGV